MVFNVCGIVTSLCVTLVAALMRNCIKRLRREKFEDR